MNPQILGIHHVTAIASDPQRNVDFYVGSSGNLCPSDGPHGQEQTRTGAARAPGAPPVEVAGPEDRVLRKLNCGV